MTGGVEWLSEHPNQRLRTGLVEKECRKSQMKPKLSSSHPLAQATISSRPGGPVPVQTAKMLCRRIWFVECIRSQEGGQLV